jgi:23S rRNA-/tRNA-specific pseudouridylate synthase
MGHRSINPQEVIIYACRPYEDNHCLAVAKPAGLLTQGVPAGILTLEAEARSYLKTKYHKEGNVYRVFRIGLIVPYRA